MDPTCLIKVGILNNDRPLHGVGTGKGLFDSEIDEKEQPAGMGQTKLEEIGIND